jgi:mRNA interferase RelE/StbE
MHQTRFLPAAVSDLKRLDKRAAAAVVQRIRWLGENADSIIPKRLAGPLSGLCKLREGDYRIIYQLLREEKTIVIHAIGHRKDIYRKM